MSCESLLGSSKVSGIGVVENDEFRIHGQGLDGWRLSEMTIAFIWEGPGDTQDLKLL